MRSIGPVSGSLLVGVISWYAIGPSAAAAQNVPQAVNSRSMLADAPMLPVREDLRITPSSDSRNTLFESIRALAVGEDGLVYILDSGNRQVSVFDPFGRHVGSMGLSYEDPTRFRRPTTIAAGRDTILILESGSDAPRLGIFSKDGTLLESVPADIGGMGYPRRLANAALRSCRDGWLIAGIRRVLYMPSTSEPISNHTDVYRVDLATGSISTRLFTHPRRSFFLIGRTVPGNETRWYTFPFFSAEPRLTIGHDMRFYSHEGGEYVIKVHDTQGEMMLDILGDVERTPITPADIDAAFRKRLEDMRKRRQVGEAASHTQAFEQEGRAIGAAELRPVLGRMFASETGYLLVERVDIDWDPVKTPQIHNWDLLGPDGIIVGRIKTPAQFTLREFKGSHLYATSYEADGAPSLVRMLIIIP